MPKFILLSYLLLLTACSSSSRMMATDTGSLQGLQAMGRATVVVTRKSMPTMGRIREMALRETALSLGAQAGLAWRAQIIDDQLVLQDKYLAMTYDFNALVLQHNIVPPVLLEGRNILNMPDGHTIRISDRTYKIAKQAHFLTSVPNWREYLWMDFTKPEAPNSTLLPITREESDLWCAFVAKGWRNGVDQANIIFEENIARLNQDFLGMIRYRKLLAMNIVSPPFVASTNLGITGDTNELHIDDRVLRIVAMPLLNTNIDEWRAAVAKDENILEQFKNMEKSAQTAKIIITSKAWQPVIAPVNTANRHEQ